MSYQPLTKIITVDDKECVVCRYYGTDTCQQIHSPDVGCNACPMMAVILNQLHAFEEAFLAKTGDANE